MHKILLGIGMALGAVVYGKITYVVGFTKGYFRGADQVQ